VGELIAHCPQSTDPAFAGIRVDPAHRTDVALSTSDRERPSLVTMFDVAELVDDPELPTSIGSRTATSASSIRCETASA
jgi:hypothetical protein